LPGLPLLRSFSFYFPSCARLGELTLDKLSQNLRDHNDLEFLYVDLNSCDVAKRELVEFGKCIETLPSLKYLRFQCRTNRQVENKDLKKFAEKCNMNFPNLKIDINDGVILFNCEESLSC